ncbi:MAG: 30S ribosomal protein S4 [Candidatus Taylorbacteria bacterium RIFCSPLOWO2_01_FULL_44_26]|uniref:Small ribosomal subunit protein uS4 n=2 Tax=Candidatus Tayloriibacteriota TaxID=1817919 RepID=A0A1G2MLS4_9BACT|nr:MAG: 30S ribosomal protein S4 [Candidatus Taylorbacteria bacterium RIFCSPHIGHO2_02_FULL_44_12]OHA31404.1 MAG: 30S ribosomal protein S4 [Candidatus Taylorbacteria bacterium RIFCSPLOWO2_01_FULL_44_26]
MKIGPRYKKARYLGVPVFRKTQTQKFSIRSQRKAKNIRRRGNKSEYGQQMMEKQRARYSYGVSGKQFTSYVKKALKIAGDNGKNLLHLLESRLDNVIVRSGFAPTRSAARQMVSHGHITVDGIIVNVPSYSVSIGETLSIRPGSRQKVLFSKLEENLEHMTRPNWLSVDLGKKEIRIESTPDVTPEELLFNVQSVLEFYTR